ncbi:MAG: hypothetical protein MI739_13785 [Bacteroidales bacterium]|nr:hypothetical protein [Bacteroidales bacterium]
MEILRGGNCSEALRWKFYEVGIVSELFDGISTRSKPFRSSSMEFRQDRNRSGALRWNFDKTETTVSQILCKD